MPARNVFTTSAPLVSQFVDFSGLLLTLAWPTVVYGHLPAVHAVVELKMTPTAVGPSVEATHGAATADAIVASSSC